MAEPALGAGQPCSVRGLSTTVANERLVEEVELIVRAHLNRVKEVTWRSRLSFLQTQEGAPVLLCCAALLVVGACSRHDRLVFAEVLIMLPFHFFAWYISFRLPRVEQLRAIGKVRDCIQRFTASEDAFTCTTRSPAAGACDAGEAAHTEATPPSSFCVSVLRDRSWRQIPYNMIVEGDVFKLHDGETFPCRAERLAVRLPHGAVPTGEVFEAHAPCFPAPHGQRGAAAPALGCFRALSTACLPMVGQFLQGATASVTGRTDTVFFEISALVRVRLRKFSLLAFLATAAACASWQSRPEVFEQDTGWHLRRALLPFRLVICLLPLAPVVLLQLTDVWGNARIQSLFEWHAGLADDDSGKGGAEDARRAAEEVSPGSGEMDASRVPMKRQLQELLDILRQGLDGPSNLMHTLNSTTVVAFCDKEGLLTDTCTTVAEVCLCGSAPGRAASPGAAGVPGTWIDSAEGARLADGVLEADLRRRDGTLRHCAVRVDPGASYSNMDGSFHRDEPPFGEGGKATSPPRSPKISAVREGEDAAPALQTVVLDVRADASSPCGARFEDAGWRQHLPQLKPLGLGMALARQPREPPRQADGTALFELSLADLCEAHNRGGSPAALHDCLCNVSQLIGFRDDVAGSYSEVKYCMEICRTRKAQLLPESPSAALAAASSAAASATEASPGSVTSQGPAHITLRAEDTPSERSTTRGSPEQSPRRRPPSAEAQGGANYSQTMATWLVKDSRDQSLQMFCKAKPKRLLPKCGHYFDGKRVAPLLEEDKQALLRIVLQWKASGLVAVAFAYRPLANSEEVEVATRLQRHNFFLASEIDDGSLHVTHIGRDHLGLADGGPDGPDARDEEPPLAASMAELQSDQVLIGMAGVKLGAAKQTEEYAGALQTAGIRFQVYSHEGEKRTRTLGDRLGLETGWNCLISLDPNGIERRNMMGQVVLPCGIANIRKHTKEIDNVPLLVSLYANSTPSRARQMIGILQENGECVTCVGSALQPNFETFRQTNISVSVLVGAVPQCRRCLGRREPRPGEPGGDHELVVSGIVNRAEFQLSADLTSLPCALQARHSYSDGEQRTLGVLFNAIKEARRCVDCILLVLIHYYCGALQLAVIVALQAVLCLPEALQGVQAMLFLFVLLPVVSASLLFNEASPQLMKELPLKKADEKTLAQPGRLMSLYACRSVPTALVLVVAFLHDLHRVTQWQVDKARDLPSWGGSLQGACDGLDWTWWITGRWPRCASALEGGAMAADAGWDEGSAGPWQSLGPYDDGRLLDSACARAHAQQWAALLFVVYEVALAFTFLDRYDSLLKRGPASNKVLCAVAVMTLLANWAAGSAIVSRSCGKGWHAVLMPSWDFWLTYVLAWPILAIAVSEATKRRDRRYHSHLQRTLRVLFNTRLGMWSPK